VEATSGSPLDASSLEVSGKISGSIPIGRPIANTRIYLLDASMQPVPVGVAGEIWIGGAGVARGYLNRPELTAERFVASPFVAGDRLYRTGDLGRYLADGEIEFLGRNDFQVKVRGFRIELGEIEARLAAHPAVGDAVVVARAGPGGDPRLTAYYTAPEGSVTAEALRTHVAQGLPEHMVPAAYVRLEALPLTPNGKLDRAALPAPEGEAFAQRAYEAPQGPVETALAQIWSELLGVERVGRQDNFFELGGHSLLAIRMIARARQALGLEASVAALFEASSLAGFAQVVGAARQAPPIEAVGREGPLALSFAQERLWFLSHLAGVSEAYHIPAGVRLRGVLDEAALQAALDRIVWRHESLRTSFGTQDGEACQRIGPAEAGFALRVEDLEGSADAQASLAALARSEAQAPFDLERGPLIRGRLIRLGPEDHVLLVTMHHIVSDGWSMGVLTRELSALYGAYVRGEPDPLEPLAIQYADYAVWQRRWLSGEVLAEQSGYWREQLAGAPALLELPTDRPRPAQQAFAGGFVGLELDAELTASLKALSQRHGVTLFMLLLAGWSVVLSRLSNQSVTIFVATSTMMVAPTPPMLGQPARRQNDPHAPMPIRTRS